MKNACLSILLVLTLLFSVLVFVYADVENKSTADSIYKEYNSLQNEILNNTELDEDGTRRVAYAYSHLFNKIKNGSLDQEKEFAQLLRMITKNKIKFKDNEVFALAAELSDVYLNISKGGDFGVQNIEIISDYSGDMLLRINYIDVSAYSLRVIKSDEAKCSDELFTELDNSFGNNWIEITFYDSKASSAFIKNYPVGEVQEINDVPSDLGGKIQVKSVYSPDHAFIIYIGLDLELLADEQERTIINGPIGCIDIKLKTQG